MDVQVRDVRVDYSVEEAQALINLLDAAVKAVGLQGAGAAVVLAERVSVAMRDAEQKRSSRANSAGADTNGSMRPSS